MLSNSCEPGAGKPRAGNMQPVNRFNGVLYCRNSPGVFRCSQRHGGTPPNNRTRGWVLDDMLIRDVEEFGQILAYQLLKFFGFGAAAGRRTFCRIGDTTVTHSDQMLMF